MESANYHQPCSADGHAADHATWQPLCGVLTDPGLSLAAKGLLGLLLCCPRGAVVGRAELFARSADPMATLDQAVSELARASRVVIVPPTRRSQGRRAGGVKLAWRPLAEPDRR